MKQINQIQKDLVHSFAKSNKISHTKLEGLISDVFAAFPTSAHKGRQPSASTVALRNRLNIAAEEKTLDKFTMKQLAAQFNANPADVTNLVKAMAKQGKAFQIGSAPKVVGTRGKVPMLWSFLAPAKRPVEGERHE